MVKLIQRNESHMKLTLGGTSILKIINTGTRQNFNSKWESEKDQFLTTYNNNTKALLSRNHNKRRIHLFIF